MERDQSNGISRNFTYSSNASCTGNWSVAAFSGRAIYLSLCGVCGSLQARSKYPKLSSNGDGDCTAAKRQHDDHTMSNMQFCLVVCPLV